MTNKLIKILIVLIIFSINSFSQDTSKYFGGSYDGYSLSTSAEILLNGDTPIANKYYGGSYDGYSLGTSSEANLNGETPYAQKYYGGSYDGYSLSVSTESNLNGETPLAEKYYGGSYDGYSLSTSSETNLNGETPLAEKYYGGSYDGYSLSISLEANLNGETPLAEKYYGGSYDGYALSTASETNLNGEATMAEKYYGGSYDGYSLSSSSEILLNGGAITSNKYFGGSYDGYASYEMTETPLMVTLSAMSHSVFRNNVKLVWEVIMEYNNKGFQIERTIEGLNQWQKITFINGRGNANSPLTYFFTDMKLKSGKYKYRIKQIDYSGNSYYYNFENTALVGAPDKFVLKQNYPNPFNPSTKIDFELPVECKVTIKLYDITGREITVLLNNEFKTADYYTLDINVSKFASGVYFYRLTTDGFSETKKMILMK